MEAEGVSQLVRQLEQVLSFLAGRGNGGKEIHFVLHRGYLRSLNSGRGS